MKLLKWMRREGVDDDSMAARLNEGLPSAAHCTGYAVKKWKYGERQAPPDKIARIEEVTNHEVTLRDLIQATPPAGSPSSTEPAAS